MIRLTSLAFVACVVLFGLAIVGYAILIIRYRKPVSFLELGSPAGERSRLGVAVKIAWSASMVCALLSGGLLVARNLTQ